MFNYFTNCPLVKGIAIGVGASALGFCLYKANEEKVDAFLRRLEARHISATVRREMGADIGGACGQLRRSRLRAQA